jgi:two-component system chemotaxis sensor kinase CheA
VKLVTVGSDTTIDKAIIDKLGEPLLHLVRNSVAHGIESPKEREKAGKPVEATIELRAEQLSDRVVISVSDDGRGLNEEKIAARGRSLGIDISRMDGNELYPLIFQPGFSTADGVSTLSGRGVGLDVVASTIETIGGSISVSSDPGVGVTFRLDLPLTLAVVKALFVDIQNEVYALPLSYVEESFRINEAEIHLVNGKPTLPWRGRLIQLVDGGDLLGAPGSGSQEFCVVISVGVERRGLRVGGLRGHRDVVVKGLESTMVQQDLLSGVTILGDGRVVFILDATRITGGSFGGGVPYRQEISGGGGEARV